MSMNGDKCCRVALYVIMNKSTGFKGYHHLLLLCLGFKNNPCTELKKIYFKVFKCMNHVILGTVEAWKIKFPSAIAVSVLNAFSFSENFSHN